VHVETIVVLPDRIRVEEELPEGRFTAVVTPEAAFESARDTGLWDMTAEQRMRCCAQIFETLLTWDSISMIRLHVRRGGNGKDWDTETRMLPLTDQRSRCAGSWNRKLERILREAYSEEGMIVTTDFEDWETKTD